MTRTLVLGLSALLVVLLAVAVVATRPAAACSCAQSPLADYAGDVSFAFTGTQTDRAEVGGLPLRSVLLTFDVDQVHHGAVGETFTAHTAGDSAACGVDFAGRGPVALAVFGPDDDPSVGLCGSEVPEADLAAVFGPGAEPDPEVVDALAPAQPQSSSEGGGVPWAVVVVAAVGVLALVALFFAGTVRIAPDAGDRPGRD